MLISPVTRERIIPGGVTRVPPVVAVTRVTVGLSNAMYAADDTIADGSPVMGRHLPTVTVV